MVGNINNKQDLEPPIIEAEDVTVRFPLIESPDVYAVKNFNISINQVSLLA